MKIFMVEYTLDGGDTRNLMLFNAKDKSNATIGAYLELPFSAIVIDVFEVV